MAQKMKLKAVAGIILSLLLIGMLTLAFNIQPAESSQPPPTEWARTYGGANPDFANSVVETADGGYALFGFTGLSGAFDRDFWLVKTDSSGNHQWNKIYGGANRDQANSVVETADGGYALFGTTKSFGAGSGDFWLIKVGVTTKEVGVTKVFHAVVDNTTYTVTTNSNSAVSNFNFDKTEMQISFDVTGESGTNGYCNVTIPESLLKGSPWTIKIDDTPIAIFDEKTNDTHTFLYFTYTHEIPLQVTIEGTWVVQEFPSFIILPLFMLSTLIAVVSAKKYQQRRFERKAGQ